MDNIPLRDKILETIVSKSTLKQKVFDNTFATFNDLKEALLEMASEMDDELDGKLDRRVRIEYRDRGKFEAQLQLANDLLIFQMHTDVFQFDADHAIWGVPYVQDNKENSYCGIINIYNFLSDSFKFNRNADEGYLIGRIFINREMHRGQMPRSAPSTAVRTGGDRSQSPAFDSGIGDPLLHQFRFVTSALRGQQTGNGRPVQQQTRQFEIRNRQTFGLRIQCRRHLIHS